MHNLGRAGYRTCFSPARQGESRVQMHILRVKGEMIKLRGTEIPPLSGEMRRCAENVKYFRGAAALTGNRVLRNERITEQYGGTSGSSRFLLYMGIRLRKQSVRFFGRTAGLRTDEQYCYTVFVYIKITDVSCIFGQHVVI